MLVLYKIFFIIRIMSLLSVLKKDYFNEANRKKKSENLTVVDKLLHHLYLIFNIYRKDYFSI